ncbi:MAG: (d)CMP kinase [Burkholderiales bacterium]|nr:(d)CMP kinase [Burkholderiales bacterium]
MTRKRLPSVIAIDGPTASGKGTVAAGVAAALGFHYLDSGALYRVVALAALRGGVRLEDGAALAALAQRIAPVFVEGKIVQDGEDITLPIRAEDVGRAASQCAVFPAVRQALLERQRAFRQLPGLVADGRDMGSVVFPDALLKVYLTAGAGERAQRRHKQLIEKGIPATIDGLLRDLKERDARDSGRADAPLAVAPGALVLDTTGMSIVDAIGAVVAAFRQRS